MRSAFQCTDICAHCVDDILLLCSVRQIYNQADRCKCLAGVEGWELFWKLGGAEVAGGRVYWVGLTFYNVMYKVHANAGLTERNISVEAHS